MEMELNTLLENIREYRRISGRNNNNDTCDSNDGDSGESNDDDMKAYDGFSGGIRTREAIYVTSDWTIVVISVLIYIISNTYCLRRELLYRSLLYCILLM